MIRVNVNTFLEVPTRREVIIMSPFARFGNAQKGCRGAFTLIELLVVIAIISLLASILLPSLNRAKALGRSVVCKSNLHNIGMAAYQYATMWNGYVPGEGQKTAYIYEKDVLCRQLTDWKDSAGVVYERFLSGKKVWRCPSDNVLFGKPPCGAPGNRLVSYRWNLTAMGSGVGWPEGQNVYRLQKFKEPGRIPVFGDAEGGYTATIHILGWHSGKSNLLYLDSHVEEWVTQLSSPTEAMSWTWWWLWGEGIE